MTGPRLRSQALGPALLVRGRLRGLAPPAWPVAASSVPALAAPAADFADPLPPQGSDDEVWMVSYMDIMTLLLTLFVLLFVYTRAIAPESIPARGANGRPQQVEGQREPMPSVRVPEIAMLDAERPVILPPGWLASVVEPPIPELMARLATAAVAEEGGVERGAVAAGEMPVADPVAAEPMESRPAPPGTDAQTLGQEGSPAASVNATLAETSPDAEPVPNQAAAVDREDQPGRRVVEVEEAHRAGVMTSRDRSEAAAPQQVSEAPPPAEDAEQRLLAAIEASAIGRRVEVTRREDAVNLEVSDEILFDRGSATLRPAGEALLADLAGLLAQQAVTVSVEGHTDSLPIRTARFASNWELSTARAITVTRQLIAHAVDPARVRAVGHADTRPRADNATAEGRSRNRRVSVVLHVPAGVTAEPKAQSP